jgi:hypothetical protein
VTLPKHIYFDGSGWVGKIKTDYLTLRRSSRNEV